jgi:hypothetical protein
MPAFAGMTGGWMDRPDAANVLCCFRWFPGLFFCWLKFDGDQQLL